MIKNGRKKRNIISLRVSIYYRVSKKTEQINHIDRKEIIQIIVSEMFLTEENESPVCTGA